MHDICKGYKECLYSFSSFPKYYIWAVNPTFSAFRYKPTGQITDSTKVDQEIHPVCSWEESKASPRRILHKRHPSKEWCGILPRGPGAAGLAQSKLGFVFCFHKEHGHDVEALLYKTALHSIYSCKSLIFFFLNPPFQVAKQRDRVFLLPNLWKTFSV